MRCIRIYSIGTGPGESPARAYMGSEMFLSKKTVERARQKMVNAARAQRSKRDGARGRVVVKITESVRATEYLITIHSKQTTG